MIQLTARQVHLDFHTSPLIEGIGEHFNKENFQKALIVGNVSSVTIFAKCHHSQCYYPTNVGSMHPHLKYDLLGEMLSAAHEIGVKAPVYITAGWSALDAEMHPEWRAKLKDGSFGTMNFNMEHDLEQKKPHCSWIDMCLNDGSYANHIYELTKEICDRYERIDGLFYDICFHRSACYCDECIEGMKKMGLNSEIENDVKNYYDLKHNTFMKKCKDILHQKNPEGTIFFNSGGADQYRPQYHEGSTHFELEDLPTAWGGYDKMPPRAKFFANTGKEYLGMTGKFHTEWGEFGGFKSKEALKFETASMLMYGAKCSIGDQMHPDGEMDLCTYENIGYAYEYVEKIEEFCYKGEQTTKLGVYLSGNAQSDEGLVKLLLETQNDFDIVYQNNYTPFQTVIFPDCVVLDNEGKNKLIAFIKCGGSVLFTGDSLVENEQFQIDIGIEYQGNYGYEIDYIEVSDVIAEKMITTPFLCYSGAAKVVNHDGEVLAKLILPYFNRTYGHYCSHKNTPYDKRGKRYPALIKSNNIVYLAHKIGEMYYQYGSVYHKQYFINALNLIYKEKVLKTELLSAGRASLILQPQENRYCLNLLYGSPVKRGNVEVIEDLPELTNIPVVIHVDKVITKVYLGIGKMELNFVQDNDKVSFIVPQVQCHQVVIIEYIGNC